MVGPPDEPHHLPMMIFDGKGDLEFFHDLLPHIHRAGRLHQLRVLNPARPDISVLYNPFHCTDEDYMSVVNMVFGSFNLHDEFFAKHQLNYLADIVRVLVYTGLKFNFYDLMVMAIDQQVLREQVEKATQRIARDPGITTQRRLNFEMSVKNLYQSFQDRDRVPKIQGLLNECMTFLDDELAVITGPYEDLLSIDEVIDQELILFVTLNVNKNTEPVRALGKMLLQNMQLVVGKRYESEEQRRGTLPADVQRGARRVRTVRVQQLCPDPADGPGNEHLLPLLHAEPAAAHAGRPRVQGGGQLGAQHNHHATDAGRGNRAVLPAGLGGACSHPAQPVGAALEASLVMRSTKTPAGRSRVRTGRPGRSTSTSKTSPRDRWKS